MVVTDLPATCEICVWHEKARLPSMCTMQAPHRPVPQPNLVPVSLSSSRMTHRSGVAGGASEFWDLPLTLNWTDILDLPVRICVFRRRHGGTCIGMRVRAHRWSALEASLDLRRALSKHERVHAISDRPGRPTLTPQAKTASCLAGHAPLVSFATSAECRCRAPRRRDARSAPTCG